MAPPVRSRLLRKEAFSTAFKSVKPVLYSESSNLRSALPTNIRAISWSATGSLVATCTHSYIRVWSPDKPNVKSSTELRNAHPRGGVDGSTGDVVEKIAFCPTTDNLLASTGHDGYVRLWDVRIPGGAAGTGKGTPLSACQTGDQGHFLTWHPQGTALLAGRKDDVVHAIDVRKMIVSDDAGVMHFETRAEELNLVGKSVYNVMAFSNSGREVFATTQSGEVKLLDFPSMELLFTLGGHTATTYTVQQAPSGHCVAVGSADSLISLWDTRTWLCTHTIRNYTNAVRDLSFSFDGAYLVAGSGSDARDGNSPLDVFHVDTGETVHTLETKNAVSQVAWHPTRYWIAYAGDPGGLQIYGAGTII